MKLFLIIFSAILAAAAVIFGFQSYRENRAEAARIVAEQKVRDEQARIEAARAAEKLREINARKDALEREANQQAVEFEMTVVTNWRNHATATRWLGMSDDIATRFDLVAFRRLADAPRPVNAESAESLLNRYASAWKDIARELRRAASEERDQRGREMRSAEEFDQSGLKLADRIDAALTPKS